MTSNSDKLRSLILAALMVFSVFAGTVALSGSAAAQTGNDVTLPEDADPLNTGGSYFAGQEVYVQDLTQQSTFRVRELNSDDEPSTLRRTLNSSDDGVISFELTGTLSDGDFVIVDSSGQPINTDGDGVASAGTPLSNNSGAVDPADQFEVVTQDLTAEFDESSVGNEGSAATVKYDISSDVRAGYNVNISAQGDLDNEDLSDIFGSENVTYYFEDDGSIADEDTVIVDGDTEYTLNFTDIDADTYTFDAEVTDTDASDSDDIEVSDTADAEAGFGNNIFTQDRGDVANITVEMTSTDTATLQIGQVNESGYGVVAEVVDDDEDGVAYVEFNSFLAGNNSTLSDTVTNGDDDTSIETVREVDGSYDQDEPDTNTTRDDFLDAGDYNLLTVEGEVADTVSDRNALNRRNADARATLSLNEPSVENLQIWTTSPSTLSDLRNADAEDIPAFAQAGNLTQTSSIAEGDGVVVQVEGSGFEGAVDAGLDYGDLATFDADNEDNSGLFSLAFAEDTAPNQDDRYIQVNDVAAEGQVNVIYDDANDQHFVVFSSTDLADAAANFETGDEYTANITTYDENSDLFGDSSATQDFSVEEPELELDTNADDEIVLQAGAGQEVTGDTNLAPGTEIEVSLDSDTSGDPFVKRPEAIVQSDGTFTAVADFSENNAGSEFTATALSDTFDSDDYDGRLVETVPDPVTDTPDTDTPDTDTPDTPDTDTPDTDTPDTDTPDTDTPDTDTPDMGTDTATETADSNETDEEATTGGSGPGFTAALALIALVAAALLAVLRNS